MAARRRRRRARRSRCSSEHARSPGVTTAELDAIAEEFIRSQRRRPDLQGLPGLSRPRSASRRTTMVVHGIPGDYCARGGRHHLDRRRRDARRLRRRLGLHVPGRRRSRPRRSGCSTSARPRSTPGSRRRRLGNAVGDISHAVQTVVEDAGFSRRPQPRRPRRRPARCTRIRRCRTSCSPYRGPELVEGMTIAIEPMITAGGPEVYARTTTNGRSRPRTARWRPISSTPSRSPPQGPRILTAAAGVACDDCTVLVCAAARGESCRERVYDRCMRSTRRTSAQHRDDCT